MSLSISHRKPHLGSVNLYIGAFLMMKFGVIIKSQAIVLTKPNQCVSLQGLCSRSDREERRRKAALSGADVQWEPQESRSAEWSRCHLDIHFTDSNHSPPFIWYPALGRGMEGEHRIKRKHVYPVQITALPGCCCWVLHTCSLLSKW